MNSSTAFIQHTQKSIRDGGLEKKTKRGQVMTETNFSSAAVFLQRPAEIVPESQFE